MTFDDKLNAMRRDLASIVARMNKDRSHRLATLAQEALTAVDELQTEIDHTLGGELPWNWKPSGD